MTINTQAFSASEWIARNTRGGVHITAETQTAVSNFTTMWNFFESALCENRASVAAFEKLMSRCQPDAFPKDIAHTLVECITFWRFRYRTPHGFGDRFSNLHFRKSDRRDLVESVLSSDTAPAADELLALMIIVYRIRNNLFHGLKSFEKLNEQTKNLDNASRCMAAILTVVPSAIVHPERQLQLANA
ncbi:hypothetical protein FVQ98_18535 [Ottowia sp. GY511]|uniref:Apea-like HEPN domain-containing protein n=1 Tax=Ottowia flava TaxID=2675430 RepID=A0ABW4KTS7_9BURK|nr:hypothetical protein [Ottowia sp. GY511]TXK22414.1 hypothetical protein FVQ98_18535 [Ottowia sp. GY511]